MQRWFIVPRAQVDFNKWLVLSNQLPKTKDVYIITTPIKEKQEILTLEKLEQWNI